jgi:hypothetical protein
MGRHALLAALVFTQAGCNSGGRLQPSTNTLQLAPLALDFGPQRAGSVSVLPVTITNSGSAVLRLSMRLERDARHAFSAGVVPSRLEPGEEFELTVSYVAPMAEGPDGVSVVIESDSFSTAATVLSISGRSVVEVEVVDAGVALIEPNSNCEGAPAVFQVSAPAAASALPGLAWNGSSNLLVHRSEALEAVTLSQQGRLSAPMQLMADGVSGRAAFMGTGYGLVSWRWRGWTGSEVVFARLNNSGWMVPSSLRQVPRVHDFQTDPAIAWNPVGREWGLLWHEWDNGSKLELRFARLTEAGVLIEGSVIELGQGHVDGSGSTLVFGGGSFATLQQLSDPPRLRLVRIGSVGEVSFTDVAEAATFHAQNVAWNGLDFGLSWVETVLGNARVKFARVGENGLVVTGSVRTLHSFPALEAPTGDLVASGAGWLATWSATPLGGRGDIFVARLSAEGELAAGFPLQLTCDARRDAFPVLSAGGVPTAVAFTRFGENGSQVFSAQLP